jgi:4'-phosphopantetheinyl transferase
MDTVARERFGDGIEFVAVSLDPGTEAVCALEDCLSDAERRRASRLARVRDRRRFIVARARLRQLIGERLGVQPQRVEITYGRLGKPALAGAAGEEWRFNVSHHDDVAIYVFARGREVGVDLEAVRALPEADAIAASFFSPCEARTYLALEPEERTLAFFSCWTRKEALVKALGEGLSMPLHAFDVSLAPGEPPAVLRIREARGDGGWALHSFSPRPGFIAAVAARRE